MNRRPGAADEATCLGAGSGRARRGAAGGGEALGRRTGAADEAGTRSAGAGRAAVAVSSSAAAVSARATESTAGFRYCSLMPAVESLLDPELNSHGAATAPSTTSVTTPAGSQRNLAGSQRHLEGGGG